MKRHVYWIVPMVALALVGLTNLAKADDAKKGTLNVKVTDSDGKAVADAQVRVFVPMKHHNKAENQAADAGAKHAKAEAVATGTTDADGVAKIEVDPGDYVVRANVKGQKLRGMAKATAKAGETTDVSIKVEAPAPKPTPPAVNQ
jgi:hypothetical protein